MHKCACCFLIVCSGWSQTPAPATGTVPLTAPYGNYRTTPHMRDMTDHVFPQTLPDSNSPPSNQAVSCDINDSPAAVKA
jgi:hypothetical protein